MLVRHKATGQLYVLGIAFLVLSLLPFLILTSDSSTRNAILPIYTAFFVSLIVGIVSPNYIYFGATFIGVAISTRIPKESLKVIKLAVTERLVSLILIAVVIFTLSVQSKDYLLRREISQLTQLGAVSPIDLSSLTRRTIELPDAGYRYLVSRNLYIVGECAKGDAILEAMRKTNILEGRILRLKEFKQNCEQNIKNP